MKNVLTAERNTGSLTVESAGKNHLTISHNNPESWDAFKRAVLARKEAYETAPGFNKVQIDSKKKRITFFGRAFQFRELKSIMGKPGHASIRGSPDHYSKPSVNRVTKRGSRKIIL